MNLCNWYWTDRFKRASTHTIRFSSPRTRISEAQRSRRQSMWARSFSEERECSSCERRCLRSIFMLRWVDDGENNDLKFLTSTFPRFSSAKMSHHPFNPSSAMSCTKGIATISNHHLLQSTRVWCSIGSEPGTSLSIFQPPLKISFPFVIAFSCCTSPPPPIQETFKITLKKTSQRTANVIDITTTFTSFHVFENLFPMNNKNKENVLIIRNYLRALFSTKKTEENTKNHWKWNKKNSLRK